MQRFLAFLPDGESASEAVIGDDLESLLIMPADELWAIAKADSSLLVLVASFLRYARRPFDEGSQQQSATETLIWQRMLPLMHRLVCAEERGAPPKADRAAVLSRVLDLPRLLDLCSLYSAPAADSSSGSSSSLLARVVAAAFGLLPQLSSQAAQAAPLLAQNLGQVAEACLTAAGSASRDSGMMQSLQDGVSYLRDTCLTLASLLQAYPAAAALLLRQGALLVEALGAVHDQLLPAVHRVACAGASSGGGGGGMSPALLGLLRRSCHVELASERLAQLLLLHAYIQPPSDGSSSSAAGSSASGSSGGSAVARGEALLQALMLLGHREQEGGMGAGSSGTGGAGGGLSLAKALAQRFGLGGSIEAAQLSGVLCLDEAQADYVAALLGVRSLAEAPGPPVPVGSKANSSLAAGAGDGASGSRGPDMEALKLQIQQVKDLLPDFGDGFIAACLQQLGGSSERVLNALLESTLPAQLSDLDPQLSLAAWQAAASTSDAASGAGAATQQGFSGSGRPPAGSAYQHRDSDFPATLPGGFAGASGSGSAKAENKTARYLDVRDESYREALVTAANAAQWDYDDEWDDSQEDLVKFGAAGIAEIEEDSGPRGMPAFSPAAPGLAAAQRGVQALTLQPGAAAFQPVGGRPGPQGQRPGSQGQARQQKQQQQGQRQQQQGASHGQGHQQQQQQQQQPQQRGPKAKGAKLWVMDGRIYNYAKPGAQEVGGRQEAEAALATAQQAAEAIMGLGPGGNKPGRRPPAVLPQQQQGSGARDSGAVDDAAAAGDAPDDSGAGGGRGGGRGDGGGGRGRGRTDRFKDQHKGAIGNHHRRDRAAAKQGRGMW
ncbi:hypothetical protein D9Q98_006430 [Chlorella vulgaris]|uniref:CUE domain-containing protein n=1 Tax=Chlorella vulgaris TaxID=3077 RepID=A0A9D4TKC1_CHLVU|nr:hypothetical protein D9Q98_006430 [Chlorella vulgaris]